MSHNLPYLVGTHADTDPDSGREPQVSGSVVGSATSRVDMVAVGAALLSLKQDPDPGVVFGQLPALCVPAVCDEVTVEVRSDGSSGDRTPGMSGPQPAFNRRPRSRLTDGDPAKFSVTVHIPGDHDRGVADSDYLAVLTCSWWLHEPTPADVAVVEMLGRAAVGLVAHARQSVAFDDAQRRVDNLNRALETNRAISAAVGILMVRRQLSYEGAFTLLRAASQRTNQKISCIADAVVFTGELSC